jgi:hypothetical protein
MFEMASRQGYVSYFGPVKEVIPESTLKISSLRNLSQDTRQQGLEPE